MLDIVDLENRVKNAIDSATVNVDTDGYYYNFSVVSQSFEGLNQVKRQQMIYAGLNDLIADGSLHAVNIVAKAPSEVD